MSDRIALVIGINTYDHDRIPPLTSPAADAEAIARRLETDGDFKVYRLPEAISTDGEGRQPQVGARLRLTKKELGDRLKQLLVPDSPQHPETVLIYFSGHGLRDPEGPTGLDKGYLLTSDSNPEDERPGIPLAQLQNWLSHSPIKNQIVWLDCCHSGGLLLDVAAANPERRDGYSRCFIASSRDFEPSWTDLNTPYSTLTKALLQGLDPARSPSLEVTSYGLVDFINQALKAEPQSPICDNFGSPILLIRRRASPGARDKEMDAFRQRWAIPRQMPPLPEHCIERPEHQTPVKACLLAADTRGSGTLVVSALYGLGGIGKSVLAAQLAHDPDVQGHFSDGILWVTLGQTPDLLPLLSDWIEALGDRDYRPTTEAAASAHLRTLLYDKTMLLVVDDVWHPDHLEPFRVGGQHCCVLVTTREARIPDARRHEVDAMTPEQALALITQTLARPLKDRERPQALDLAERVGFLPLALELAIAQVRDGVTWDELLTDFQAEVGRLDSLDRYRQEELPDDSQRRRHSVLACFNLSLRLLSPEQRGQFAWLSILPEDAQITQTVAALLWQVTPRQAAAILRTLRAKALLLAGVSQEGQPQTYRLHDLMHDRAQQLLTSPAQATRQGDVPGLGLTLAEAHGQLLERYHRQTQNHQWHTLPDDGYSYTYLTWHMERANQPEQVHQLLQETNDTGGNGWYGACEARGKLANFVNDLGRAWRLAGQTYQQAPATALALLFRYALIRTSLNSLAGNIPATLLGALVEKQIWQPAQGLAYAQQTQDPEHRAACLAALVPHIPESLLPEVLETIAQIHDVTYRSFALAALAQRFPPYWPEVLLAIRQIQDRQDYSGSKRPGFFSKAQGLSQIIHYLPSEFLVEVLDLARHIKSESHRADALGDLAPHLPLDLWPEALNLIRQIDPEWRRADALGDLAPHLPPDLLPEALDLARQLDDKYHRAGALGHLAKQFPDLWPEALALTRQINDEWRRASILGDLAKQFPDLLPEALDLTRQLNDEWRRASILGDLAKQFPDLLPEALALTRQLNDERRRASILGDLAKQLPDLWPEALDLTRQVQDESDRAWALGNLAPHLPPDLLPEALALARQIQDESDRADALGKLAPHLPPDLLPEALDLIRQINHEYHRAMILRDLANQFPDLLPEALDLIRQINHEYHRAMILGDLANQFPDLLPEALDLTRQINNEAHRAQALGNLAPHIPLDLLPKALEVVSTFREKYYTGAAWQSLLPRLEDLQVDFPTFATILDTLAYRSRPDLVKALPAMSNTLTRLGNEHTLDDCLDGMRQVCDQWR
jgi:hypothetical protein